MRFASFALFPLALALTAAAQAETTHFPIVRPGATTAAGPPFSAAVQVGDTLYISGSTDTDPATGKPPTDPRAGAKLLMDGLVRTLARAGMTTDDLVWVQIFASDLANYAAFNEVYRGYFKGPLPARAFIGAGSLLGGANFEIMGIAAKPKG